MSSEIRIGILGAGIRGALFTESFAQHPAVSVAGVADLNTSAADRIGAQFGVASLGSIDELLALRDLDAVVIATPDFAHRDVAIAAARAGKHLMIEKPLAMTDDDARAIASAVSDAGVTAMVGFENRWNPRFIATKALLDGGSVGELQTQVAHLNDTRWVPTSMLSWAAKSSPAWFLMPHTLDLVLWLSGKSVASVFAQGSRGLLASRGVDTWDSVDALLSFTDGTTATLHSSWILPESFPAVYDLRYEAVGSKEAVRVSGSDQGVHHYSETLQWSQWGTYRLGGRLHGFPVDMAYSFADHLLGSAEPVPTIDDGLVVTRVLGAVQQSLETGAPVPVG